MNNNNRNNFEWENFIKFSKHIYIYAYLLFSTSPPLPTLLRYVKMPQSYISPQLNDKIQMGEGDFNERENITYVKHCDVWKSLIMQKQPINIAVRIWCKFSAFRSFDESIFSCLQVQCTYNRYTHFQCTHKHHIHLFLSLCGWNQGWYNYEIKSPLFIKYYALKEIPKFILNQAKLLQYCQWGTIIINVPNE